MSIKQIKADWVTLLESGKIPFIEFTIGDGATTDIWTVELELQRDSMVFYFDVLGDNDLYLDGLTRIVRKGLNGTICAKIALKHFDNIDQVLEHINSDVTSYIYDNGHELD